MNQHKVNRFEPAPTQAKIAKWEAISQWKPPACLPLRAPPEYVYRGKAIFGT
jgi:hypothetical protein